MHRTIASIPWMVPQQDRIIYEYHCLIFAHSDCIRYCCNKAKQSLLTVNCASVAIQVAVQLCLSAVSTKWHCSPILVCQHRQSANTPFTLINITIRPFCLNFARRQSDTQHHNTKRCGFARTDVAGRVICHFKPTDVNQFQRPKSKLTCSKP